MELCDDSWRSETRLYKHKGHAIKVYFDYSRSWLYAELLGNRFVQWIVEYHHDCGEWHDYFDPEVVFDVDATDCVMDHLLDKVAWEADKRIRDAEKARKALPYIEDRMKEYGGVFYWDPFDEMKHKVEGIEDSIYRLETGSDPYD